MSEKGCGEGVERVVVVVECEHVPAIWVIGQSPAAFEFADETEKPGATTSGLTRLPTAGPCDEKSATLPSCRSGGFSEAPTVRQFLQVAGAPMEPGEGKGKGGEW